MKRDVRRPRRRRADPCAISSNGSFDRMATPLKPFWPCTAHVVAELLEGGAGKASVSDLISCRQTTSGEACLQPGNSDSSRALTPLMFQVVIFMRRRGSREIEASGQRGGYSEKLVPQPQEAVALGVLDLGRTRRSDRRRNRSRSRPGNRARPGRSAPWRRRARSRRRRRRGRRPGRTCTEKPEQPPPSTLTRSIGAAGSPATISAIRLAARSVTVTAVGSLLMACRPVPPGPRLAVTRLRQFHPYAR